MNGDPTDNRLSNLAWGTRQENHADKIRHGTTLRKLTEAEVLQIRMAHDENKATLTALAHIYDVSISTIFNVVHRNTYAEISALGTPYVLN